MNPNIVLDITRKKEPAVARAVSPRSESTRANKTAKMMTGRVLSAYRNGTLKKDGTHLYLSYLSSLEKFIENNPQAGSLQQIESLYNTLGAE